MRGICKIFLGCYTFFICVGIKKGQFMLKAWWKQRTAGESKTAGLPKRRRGYGRGRQILQSFESETKVGEHNESFEFNARS